MTLASVDMKFDCITRVFACQRAGNRLGRALFVGEGFDGVFAAGKPRGIAGAEKAACDGNDCRISGPLKSDERLGQSRKEPVDEAAREKTEGDAANESAEAKQGGLAEDDFHDVEFGGP